MTTFATLIGRGLLSARPAAGTPGALYYATDTSTMYRDNGTSWDNVEGAGAALTVDEVDGSPSVANVTHITFSNGTVTDNTGGHVTVTNSGGGSGAAGELGYAEITAAVTTTSTTMVDATGLSVTVTVPSGGRAVRITAYFPLFDTTAAASVRLQAQIYDVTASAVLQNSYQTIGAGTQTASGEAHIVQARHVPAAGSRTYKVRFMTESGTVTARIYADSNSKAYILVESL